MTTTKRTATTADADPRDLVDAAKRAQTARKAAETEVQRIEAAAAEHSERAANARATVQAELENLTAARDELAAAVALGEAAPEKLMAHDKRIAALKADSAAANASSTEAGILRRLASATAALKAAKVAEGQALLALLLEEQKQAAFKYRQHADSIAGLVAKMYALRNLVVDVEPLAGLERWATPEPLSIDRLRLDRTRFCSDERSAAFENVLDDSGIRELAEAESKRLLESLAEHGLEV